MLKKRNHFVETPNMIRNPCFHCWRDAQGLVNPAKVIVHVMQCYRCLQIRNLFREPVGQPRKSPHGHSHREVLALDVARGDMVEVGVAVDYRPARSHADCRAVAHLRAVWRSA